MTQAAIDNKDENKDKPSDRGSDKTFKITGSIIRAVHNPAITLAVGLVVSGLATMANPFKKWLEAKKQPRTRILRTFASNPSLAGLSFYVLVVAGGQLFEVSFFRVGFSNYH